MTAAHGDITNVRIGRVMRDEDGAAWARALAEPGWLSRSTLLKREEGSWVVAAELRGRRVVVKCRTLKSWWDAMRSRLGAGKGDRHWRGAAILATARIATARPIVLGTARQDGRSCEVLVMEHVAGETLLSLMERAARGTRDGLGVREQHAIARAVAEQVLDLGWAFNRDHKPSNLIVEVPPTGPVRVKIIDCVGVRRAWMLHTERMFASLLIEPIGCGVRPRRAVLMRGLAHFMRTVERIEAEGDDDDPMSADERRAILRAMWMEVADRVRRHGDPTPRTNPLAGGGKA